jgi:methionyl-tRNA synthetase
MNYYLTTPIYYVNDVPHIGHAYTNIAADVLARFKRLEGNNVRFLTGTDEHGQKVEKSANLIGLAPQDFVDKISQKFLDLSKILNLTNDDFIRTTEQRHKKAVIYLWETLEKKGHIYKGKYAGWYSVRDEAFFLESDLTEDRLAPTGAPVEWLEEDSYFFDLSKWQELLLQHYENNPDFIYPESRRNEVISFVKSGLHDLSISRTSFKWGIEVPSNQKHVIYVWLDALANYISAVGYPDQDSQLYKDFWPADLHIIGKDILRFHAVYWPAFLMAADIPLPKRIAVHGWWTNEGIKISKSVGNVIDPLALVNEFGLDQTRYFVMREIVFGNDGNFSREVFINRINSELANNIGNLAQRTLKMIQKNCSGTLPAIQIEDAYKEEILINCLSTFAIVKQYMDKQDFSNALEEIIELASSANIYIDEKAPWSLAKENIEQMNLVLFTLAESIRYIAILLLPFIPDSANKLLDLLAIAKDKRMFKHLEKKYCVISGTVLPEPIAVFPRYIEREK